MPNSLSDDELAERRKRVLAAARWCFLNFGFAKTSVEDVAKRADLSRTLLYRSFKDKDAIFQAVFADWLLSRRSAGERVTAGSGSRYARLLEICRLLVLDPWAEMVGPPMGHEFFDVCERIDPGNEALYHDFARKCVAAILDDEASAEVFMLALGGMFKDRPAPDLLEQRTVLLAARFAVDPKK